MLLMERHFGEQLLGFLVVNGRVYDHVVSLAPVHGRRYLVLVAELQRVNHTKNLVKVPARGSGVGNRQANNFLRVDDEDGPDREGETLAVTVRSILLVKHVVQRGDLSIRIGYNRELDISGAVLGAVLVDIHNPFVVILEIIGRNTDDLDIALCKVVCATSDLAELGGADRGEVSGMREEDGPRTTDPFVELDQTSCSLSLEIGGDATETEGGHDTI